MGHCSIWTQTLGSRPLCRPQPVANLLPDGFPPGVCFSATLSTRRLPGSPASCTGLAHRDVWEVSGGGMNDLRVRTHGGCREAAGTGTPVPSACRQAALPGLHTCSRPRGQGPPLINTVGIGRHHVSGSVSREPAVEPVPTPHSLGPMPQDHSQSSRAVCQPLVTVGSCTRQTEHLLFTRSCVGHSGGRGHKSLVRRQSSHSTEDRPGPVRDITCPTSPHR